MIAWEVTRNCNLNCIHCRASADMGPYGEEFLFDECVRLLDDIASFSKPIIILTGGEPLFRDDIFAIADYGTRKGLRMVMAVNGTMVTPENALRIKKSGIRRISISLDGASPESHDQFRGVEGAFAGALRGIEYAKQAGVDFQINTTITKKNLHELSQIHSLAQELQAVAHHIFVLVPTGRGKDIPEEARVTPEEYESTLYWFWEQEGKTALQLKATCAPQYYRIREEGLRKSGEKRLSPSSEFNVMTRGCLGGVAFCFISHRGTVSPCGYLELDCGNVREKSLKRIWADSVVFRELRDFKHYEGKCAHCGYVRTCGGCRARAYHATGNYLAEDPYCQYNFSGEQ
ncbi:MAG: heme b synthase [Deltaproteobacteria bacterium]|nr:heme b synthase [Deltaproteobacteria bacterium]